MSAGSGVWPRTPDRDVADPDHEMLDPRSPRIDFAGLGTRVGSAIVLAGVALASASAGGLWFVAVWTLGAIAVLWEWQRLVLRSAFQRLVGIGATIFAAAGLMFAAERPIGALTVLAVAPLAAALASPATSRGWTALGAAYAGALLATPALLRRDPVAGLAAILFLFAVVWSTDIFAYAAGRLLGGPKLLPTVSPKKTWSGAIGGMVAAVLTGTACASWAGLHNRAAIALLSLGLSVAAQAGDFAESALKRRFGAKDASRLIPGHGGLMDRLDGFLAAALAATVLGIVRGGLHAPAQGVLTW